MSDTGRYSLEGKFEVLRDASALRIDDILASPQGAGWQPTGGFPNAGYTHDAYWLAFTLRRAPGAAHEWWLEIAPAFLNKIDLYSIGADGSVTSILVKHGGNILPFSQRKVQYRNVIFRINLPDERPQRFYLRVQTASTLAVWATVWTPVAFSTMLVWEMGLLGIYYGLWLCILLQNMVAWTLDRRRIQFWWMMYLLVEGFFAFCLNGFTFQFLLPDFPEIANRLQGLALALYVFVGTWLISTMFRIKQSSHRYLLQATKLISVCGGGLALYQINAIAVPLLLIALIGLMTLAIRLAVLQAKRGTAGAGYFLVGFLSIEVISLLTLGGVLGIPTPGQSMLYAWQGNILFHIVLLNAGLVSKARSMKETQQRVRGLNRRAQVELGLAQAQRHFVAMVTHELRQPLAIIDVSLKNLQRMRSEMSSAVFERYQKIRRAQYRLQLLADNYLTGEVISGKYLHLRKMKVNCRSFFEDMVAQVHCTTPSHNVAVRFKNAPEILFVDRELFRIALMNILGNAIKYSSADGRVRVSVCGQHTMLSITIRDRGCGIAAADLTHIFEKHYRGGGWQRRWHRPWSVSR